jgi:TolA-binding protein
MNAPINRDIFKESHCISSDALVRYRDNRLSSTEKFEVERHLVDCKLCSEALEGMSQLSNTHVLNELNHELGAMTSAGGRSQPYRYLAVAASAAAMVLLFYVAYRQFSDVKDERLAVQEYEVPANTEAGETSAVEISVIKDEVASAPSEERFQSNAALAEQSAQDNSMPVSGMTRSVQVETKDQPIPEQQNVSAMETTVADEEVSMDLVKPAAVEPEAYFQSASGLANRSSQLSNITYVNNLKVIDYSNEKPKKATKRSVDTGTPSVYENREKKAEAEMAATKEGNVTGKNENYLSLIKKPMDRYQESQYELAIKGFDLVLKDHPGDQNALFYKGMSAYHLKNFDQAISLLRPLSRETGSAFSEEARFYLAKSYSAKGLQEDAASLFKQIVNEGGFYSKQAAKELKRNR